MPDFKGDNGTTASLNPEPSTNSSPDTGDARGAQPGTSTGGNPTLNQLDSCQSPNPCTTTLGASPGPSNPALSSPDSPDQESTSTPSAFPSQSGALDSSTPTPTISTQPTITTASEFPTVTNSPENSSPSLSSPTNPPSYPQSASTTNPNSQSNVESSSFAAQTPPVSAVTVSYGTDSSSATPAVNTVISTASDIQKSSNIGPIVGGVLGSLAFILLVVVALLYLRRRRRRYRIAPSSEYLASQHRFNPVVPHFTDDGLISSREG